MTAAPRVVGQVALTPGCDERDRAELAQALTEGGGSIGGVVASHAAVHFEFSVGGGDLTWDLHFESDAAIDGFVARLGSRVGADAISALGAPLDALSPRIASLELGRPAPLANAVGCPGLVGVKRTLWLRVPPDVAATVLTRFEEETPRLASAVPAIRNWAWSRLPEVAEGPFATRWTHLWEQEFETVGGLEIDYMSSPFHWGWIDRWFDPEMPDRIVDLWLAHLACPETAPVLSEISSR